MHTLASIAERVQGRLDGPAELPIRGVAGLADASEGELSFLAQSRYRAQLDATAASAVILAEDEACSLPAIRVPDPYVAFVAAIELFAPSVDSLVAPGIHPSAVIDPGAELGDGVRVGALAHVAKGVRVGARSVIGPGCMILPGARLGEDVFLHADVVVREGCTLGDRVIAQPGAVVGSDGFGFAPHDGVYRKIPQIGIVVIEDDVEIGANACIDRATTGRTVIGRGTKLDNLVQIAHNVKVGEHTVISSQSGVSGSATIGSGVVLAGQVGVAGHLTLGDRVQVGGKSGISGNVPDDSVISGIPARDHREWRRLNVHIGRLARYAETISELERRIAALEGEADA